MRRRTNGRSLTIADDFDVEECLVRFGSFLGQRVRRGDVGEVVLAQGNRRYSHGRMSFQAEGDNGNEDEEDRDHLDSLDGDEKTRPMIE